MIQLRRIAALVLAACGAAPALASIVPLDLRGMLELADSAVFGEIVEKRTWRGPLEGFAEDPEFTTLVVRGADWFDGSAATREVTYLGSDSSPVSEMPAESETRVGTRAVVFSKSVGAPWGGRTGLRSLVAAQGGVFRVEEGPRGDVVLGKGPGFAVSDSLFASELRARAERTLAEIRRKR